MKIIRPASLLSRVYLATGGDVLPIGDLVLKIGDGHPYLRQQWVSKRVQESSKVGNVKRECAKINEE